MVVKAPWTEEQVAALNAFQQSTMVHGWTCGNNRGDAAHVAYAEAHGEDWGLLIATPDGFVCPVCGYTQDWCDDSMLDAVWLARHTQWMHEVFGDVSEQEPEG